MYRGYVNQLESQSPSSQQQAQNSSASSNNMSEEDQWRKQWNAKPVDELWKELQKGNSKSLLKKHLTEDRYKVLKDKKTSLGGTLAQCISSGKNFCIVFPVQYYDIINSC